MSSASEDSVIRADCAAIAAVLAAATDITLLGHINPDADALGSALGLGIALQRMGKNVQVSVAAPRHIPEDLQFLDTTGLFVSATEVPAVPSTLVVLDSSSLDRLGSLADRVPAVTSAGGSVVVIDHHQANTRFGTHHFIDEQAEATAVLVMDLLDELAVEIDVQIAQCLYAGLLTDTGSFRWASPAAHQRAARLLATGVDAAKMARLLLHSHPFSWLRFIARVMRRAELEPAAARGLGLVHTTIWLNDFATIRAEDTRSVIDLVRTTVEAEVALVLIQRTSQRWSVEMRANSAVNVGAVAVALGGGGHRLAAGCTMTGSRNDVLDRIRAELAADSAH